MLDPQEPDKRIAVGRRFSGFYAEFACPNCERVHFQSPDNYAFSFLDSVRKHRTRWRLQDTGWWTLKHREHCGRPELLHRYAIQTLLREHLSHNRFDLGAVSTEFESLVINDAPTIESPFGVMITFIQENAARYSTGGMLLDADGSYPVLTFTIPNLLFTVAATSAGLPLPYRPFQLRAGSWVATTHWKRTPDFLREFNGRLVAGHLDRMREVLETPKVGK